jgi:hypothetical protein
MNNKLTKADINFINKFIGHTDTDTEVIMRNQYTGVNHKTNKLVADCTYLALNIFNSQGKNIHKDIKPTNWVSMFDRCKYIVLKLDSFAYYKMLD